MDPSGLEPKSDPEFVSDIGPRTDEELLANQLVSIQKELDSLDNETSRKDETARKRRKELEEIKNKVAEQYIDLMIDKPYGDHSNGTIYKLEMEFAHPFDIVINIGISFTVGAGTATHAGAGLMLGVSNDTLKLNSYWKTGVLVIAPFSGSIGFDLGVVTGTSNPIDLDGNSYIIGGSAGELVCIGMDIAPGQYPGSSLFIGVTGKTPYPSEGHTGFVYTHVGGD